MEKKVIDLEILDYLEQSGVSKISLVDVPAIEKYWMAFKQEKFVEPSSGEREDEFIPRCIAYNVDEGKDPDQAAAICYSVWERHSAESFARVSFDYDDTLSTERGKDLARREISRGNDVYIITARGMVGGEIKNVAKQLGIPESRIFATASNLGKINKVRELKISRHYDNNSDVVSNLGIIGEKFAVENFQESYTDYPEGASENARRALEWKEKNGSDCGTPIGWARARQLANREPISEETIARMASFERHRQNSETPYSEGCGKLMWDAWGGDSGIRWAQTKLESIRQEMSYDTGALPQYVDEIPKKKKDEYQLMGIPLPRGEKVVLQAEDEDYDRGLIVELKEEGGYDVQYWFEKPDNIEPAEVKVDGVKVTDAGTTVYVGYHPELEDYSFAERPIARIPEEERGRTGSAKNEPGDTKTSRGGIEVSQEVENTLKDKVKEHNEKNPQDSQKADLGMLKAVWRRGAGAYSVGTPGRRGMTRSQWAMGRVNAFLRILSGTSPSDKDYTQDNDLLPKSHPKHSETNKQDMSLALAYFRSLEGLTEHDLEFNGMRFDAETEGMDLQFAQGYTVYRYEGEVGDDTRDFCAEMVADGRFFTFQEIVGFNSDNPGFGPGGSDEYSIFHYKGGPNCKHKWQKYYVNAQGIRENKGPAPGKAGTKPIDMPNNGYMMSAEKKFLFASEDQQILVGPVAIPDMEIIRKDDDGKPYWVKFSKDVVQRMAEKFMRESKNNDTNIQHGEQDAKTYVMETWLVENKEDKANSVYGLDVPVGSWLVKMRVTDPEVWADVKAGKLRGFSLEGNFIDAEDLAQMEKDKTTLERIIKILNGE